MPRLVADRVFRAGE